MSRRTRGYVGIWAEMQRQRQRQLEAEERQRRQEARQARAYERRAAQSYREYKQAEAIRRTEELDARVAALQGLLASGCRASAFLPSALMRGEELQSLAEVMDGVARREPDAVVEYFSAALYTSTAWPEGFPRRVAMTYDPAARQLVLDWELPAGDVVPQSKYVRYMYAADQYRETPRPVGQRRALYKEVVAQCMLLVLHELFTADESGALESVALNGFVDGHDPTTGRPDRIFLATVMAERSSFRELHLAQVDAESCLADALRGQVSARPDQLVAVRPGRRPEEVGHRVTTHGDDEEPDLYEMDPIAFEGLVAELFEAMGMRAVTTQRSNDGGVDVHALDPTPIRGGQIVVQVKRYRHTVPPTAVRDLYGTVQDAGANKGVLVTTSGFGPGSHTFANGKPLELIAGNELVDLLRRHGLRGRLGEGGRPGSAPPLAPPPEPSLPDEYNILGMSWTGSVALDVCALVCRGNRILTDDHFVFYNNPRTPDGSVRTLPATAPDKAAICASFDTLPGDADRLVLVAAVDPEVNPDADLSGFTDACIRLLDPSLTELGRLQVSDGRPHETALVLGSFRRRANGDWDFVVGGRGYSGGLEELLRDYGVEVD
ncbi:restriction endonuclease [Streptomyces sp. NPDC060311]|uniref:restriction endonuclease n=1 Tax=Streptomyces sp. NPDC060311 TaxID=3347096 RepID=UPI003648FE2A